MQTPTGIILHICCASHDMAKPGVAYELPLEEGSREAVCVVACDNPVDRRRAREEAARAAAPTATAGKMGVAVSSEGSTWTTSPERRTSDAVASAAPMAPLQPQAQACDSWLVSLWPPGLDGCISNFAFRQPSKPGYPPEWDWLKQHLSYFEAGSSISNQLNRPSTTVVVDMTHALWLRAQRLMQLCCPANST